MLDSPRDATEWLARYQAFWDERFDQLDEVLASLRRESEPEQTDR